MKLDIWETRVVAGALKQVAAAERKRKLYHYSVSAEADALEKAAEVLSRGEVLEPS